MPLSRQLVQTIGRNTFFHQIRKFVLDLKDQSADANESKLGQIKLQRLLFQKLGFFCQRHEVKRGNYGEIPRRSVI